MDGINVLQKLGAGHFVDDLHAAILDVAEEVAATGRQGSVTVTLKLSHPKNTDATMVVIDEDIKRGMPKADAKGALFYALDAQLHDRDPRQPDLPAFRVVADADNRELRTPNEGQQDVREAE